MLMIAVFADVIADIIAEGHTGGPFIRIEPAAAAVMTLDIVKHFALHHGTGLSAEG